MLSLPVAKRVIYSNNNCPKTREEILEVERYPYRNVIGCLPYLASQMRPDFAFAINNFSQVWENIDMVYWQGLSKLLST